MTVHPRTAAAAAVLFGSLFLGGCNGAFVGNIVVLFVSVGIFFGTLNLGRLRPAAAEASSSSSTERSPQDR